MLGRRTCSAGNWTVRKIFCFYFSFVSNENNQGSCSLASREQNPSPFQWPCTTTVWKCTRKQCQAHKNGLTHTRKTNHKSEGEERSIKGKCLWQHAFYTCEWIINSFPELLLQKPRLLCIDAGLNYTYKSHWRAWRTWHCTICPFSIESKPQGKTRANKHPSDEEAYQIWASNMDNLLGIEKQLTIINTCHIKINVCWVNIFLKINFKKNHVNFL